MKYLLFAIPFLIVGPLELGATQSLSHNGVSKHRRAIERENRKEPRKESSELDTEVKGSIEAKASYYYPTDKTFRKIYKDGALFGLEGSILAYKDLYAYTSITFLPSKGHSIGKKYKTDLLLIPIDIGLKYFIPFCTPNFPFYIGAGMVPTYLTVTDDSPFVVRRRSKWGIGGSFKCGTMFTWPSGLLLDIFLNYYLIKMDFSNTDRTLGRTADASGLSIGGGLGFAF